MQVARAALAQLPAELGAIREPAARADEYVQYRQFAQVWDTLDRVAECGALAGPAMARETRAAWLRDYSVRRASRCWVRADGGAQALVDQAREQIVVLLTTEWLVADSERGTGACFLRRAGADADGCGAGDRRTRELVRIRQLYIPELVIRLHALLCASRTRIPSCVPSPHHLPTHPLTNPLTHSPARPLAGT